MLPSAHRVINTTYEPRMITKDTYLGVLSPVCTLEDTDDSVDIPINNVSSEPASQLLVDALPSELSDQQRQSATALIRSYEDVFSQGEYDIGRTHLVEHGIDTGDHRPIRQPLRRHPITHLEVIYQQVEEMRKSGIIEPAASPWVSNVVLAKKKDVHFVYV